MIRITKSERSELERVGLLRSRKIGLNAQDANFTVVNKEHCARDKSTYVVEDPEIMLFLGKYDNMNLQRISMNQYNKLTEKKILTKDNIQHWGDYVHNAIAFQDAFGVWRCKKVSKIMLELGIWSNNKTKKAANNYKKMEVIEAHEG